MEAATKTISGQTSAVIFGDGALQQESSEFTIKEE
jgi:hypothetical protein